MQSFDHAKKFSFKVFLKELAGSIGDYGTILPIVFGVAVVTNVNLAHILLFFSLWYIISGLYFRLPVPIEPMKAIGAIVIAILSVLINFIIAFIIGMVLYYLLRKVL